MAATLSSSKWSLHGGSEPDTCHHDVGLENTCTGTNAMAERYVLVFIQSTLTDIGTIRIILKNDFISSLDKGITPAILASIHSLVAI